MGRPRGAILVGKSLIPEIFSGADLDDIKGMVHVRISTAPGRAPDEDECMELIDGAEIVITSWGSPALGPNLLDRAPGLRLAIHAAGSVKPIVTQELIDRDITVTNPVAVVAKNVSETTLGYIIVGLKNGWRIAEEVRIGKWSNSEEFGRVRELYGLTVGVVGAGAIGREVLRLLSNFDVKKVVCDPFISDHEARELNAELVSLDDLLRRSDVVTLHAPSLPSTRHMLNASNLRHLKDGALLVNTARGALIDEEALVAVLREGKIFACLDVTDPEPPHADHPFRRLPNVVLTPHIAGGVANGRHRIGRLARDEIAAYINGEPPICPVDLSRLHMLA